MKSAMNRAMFFSFLAGAAVMLLVCMSIPASTLGIVSFVLFAITIGAVVYAQLVPNKPS
jgi:VIT1/CCC1 family predicted Fe2+/Mn2+ transporter